MSKKASGKKETAVVAGDKFTQMRLLANKEAGKEVRWASWEALKKQKKALAACEIRWVLEKAVDEEVRSDANEILRTERGVIIPFPRSAISTVSTDATGLVVAVQ